MSCIGGLCYDMFFILGLQSKYAMITNDKIIQHGRSMQNRHAEMQFRTKDSSLNISTTLSGVISHARLFVTGQLRNTWQTFAEPRLKITAVVYGL